VRGRDRRAKLRRLPTIEFLGNGFGATKTIEAPEGGALVDICDEHFAPVPFSCRSASCGTCHSEVLTGLERLGGQEELDLLGGGPASRLVCQAEVRPGPGLIRLKSHLG